MREHTHLMNERGAFFIPGGIKIMWPPCFQKLNYLMPPGGHDKINTTFLLLALHRFHVYAPLKHGLEGYHLNCNSIALLYTRQNHNRPTQGQTPPPNTMVTGDKFCYETKGADSAYYPQGENDYYKSWQIPVSWSHTITSMYKRLCLTAHRIRFPVCELQNALWGHHSSSLLHVKNSMLFISL